MNPLSQAEHGALARPAETRSTAAPRTALVTGAGKRVGRAIAERLGALGTSVAVHYRESAAGANDVCRAIEAQGARAQAFSADLADRDAARRMLDTAVEWLGSLDLLVLSAANFERIPFAQLDDAAWDRALSLNLTSLFTLSTHAVPHLKASRGNIVAITCASTLTPYRNHLPYIVSKAGALQLVRTLALELAPDVRVNAVAPGLVLAPPSMSRPEAEHLAVAVPLQHWGSAQDVADAVVFLARAPFVTGQQLLVDGGQSLGNGQRLTPA